MKMRFKFQSIALYLSFLICLVKSASSPCEVVGNRLSCNRARGDNEQIQLDSQPKRTVDKIYIGWNMNGTTASNTFSPFSGVIGLDFNIPRETAKVNGRLCSLPKFEALEYTALSSSTNVGELEPCDYLEKFTDDVPLNAENATELKSLRLRLDEPFSGSTKAELAALEQLKSLTIGFSNLESEPGLFCVQSTLEELDIIYESGSKASELTESLFDGCNNFRSIRIRGNFYIPDGQYPFSNMTHLERLTLTHPVTNHLTKNFLYGLPNLRHFVFYGTNDSRDLTIDRDAFKGATKITELRLRYHSLEDGDLRALSVLTALEILDLRNNEIEDFDSIPALPELVKLYISRNKGKPLYLDAARLKFPKLFMIVRSSTT